VHAHTALRVDVIALSLGAAFLYALTSVLQHQSTSTLKPDRSLRLSLLLGLLRQPRWLASIVVDIGAYVLQFLALRVGSVVVVQTLLVSGLLFALPLGAIAMRMRPQLHDWAATAAVVLGLGLFLGSANPSVGAEGATPRAWVTTLVVLASVVVALLACGRGRSQTHRAAALGAAGGVLYGLTAALAKASGQVLDGGVIHVLRSWEPYALGAVALAGLLVAQSAFHAGPLQASLPLLTAADPVTAGVIGVACFHEHLSDEPAPPRRLRRRPDANDRGDLCPHAVTSRPGDPCRGRVTNAPELAQLNGTTARPRLQEPWVSRFNRAGGCADEMKQSRDPSPHRFLMIHQRADDT